MCKFAFKYNINSYDCFQSPNLTIYQLKPHHFQWNQFKFVSHTNYLPWKKLEDIVVIKKLFNTKIVHNTMIIIKNILRQSFNDDTNSKDNIGKNTSTKSQNATESVVLSNHTAKLSSVTDQVSNSSILKNNTEQKCMKSPSEITTIANVSSTKLSSVTDQVSKSTISNNKLNKNLWNHHLKSLRIPKNH